MVGDAGGAVTLDRLLRAPKKSWSERAQLVQALSHPWCWPIDRELAAMAESLGLVRPAGRPGEVCLVSVAGQRVSMWSLAPSSDSCAREAAPLAKTALATAVAALRVAARDVPLLRNVRALYASPSWYAVPCAKLGDGPTETVLDGPSYGLALALSAASLYADEALPSDVVALAAIGPDGSLLCVDELSRKISILAAFGAGVKRLLVVREQALVADEASKAHRADFEVIAVETLSSALDVVFPALCARSQPAWATRGDARRVLQELFRQALRSEAPLLGWGAVARSAASLQEFFDCDEEARVLATITRQIASRHEGRPEAIDLSEQWLARLPRPTRMELLAHMVQSHADHPSQDSAPVIERATRSLAARLDRHPEDLKLLGAIARAHASAGQNAAALDMLDQAIDGWLGLALAHEASHSVCEALRLRGLSGDVDAVRSLAESVLPAVWDDARCAPASQCFLALAAGRAFSQAGDSQRALPFLDDENAPWHVAPWHVLAARRRWRAFAHALVGEHERARAERELLDRESRARPFDANTLLTRIDEAHEQGADATALLHELAGSEEGAEAFRLLGGAPLDCEGCRQVAKFWRY